jgi:hypothetical protein
MITDLKILDNFYDDPEKIFYLSNGEFPIFGCGTGKRSIGLQEVDKKLYDQFCAKIFKIHGITDPRGLHMFTFFMEHNWNPIEVFNKGWVHIDGKNPDACRMTTEDYKLVVCGQIFLTPDPDPEASASTYKLRNGVNWSTQELYDRCINDYTIPREDYEAKKINLDQFTQLHTDYHSNFEQTAEVKNVYNRMVSWKAGTLHGQRMTQKMGKRLNQYFFIQRI